MFLFILKCRLTQGAISQVMPGLAQVPQTTVPSYSMGRKRAVLGTGGWGEDCEAGKEGNRYKVV